jgi:thymidylate synthase
MSQFDKIFKAMCKDILENGYYNDSDDTRAHWSDGTPAHTIKKSCVVNRYDLSKEAPVMTLRPLPMKSCLDEIFWIWQKKSNDLSQLNSKIWSQWAIPETKNELVEIEKRKCGKKANYKEIMKNKFVKHCDLIKPIDKIDKIYSSTSDGDFLYYS